MPVSVMMGRNLNNNSELNNKTPTAAMLQWLIAPPPSLSHSHSLVSEQK